MKNWKLLAVFGLIAVLFVFAGCIAGVTPEEPTATPTTAPTVAPTPTPTETPWAGKPIITTVSFLSATDNYLNIADSEENATVEGTAPEGSEIFLKIDSKIVATGKTGDDGAWKVIITSTELQKLTDGEHNMVAQYSLATTRGKLSGESDPVTFTADLTAPEIKSASGKAGSDTEPGIVEYEGVTPSTPGLNVINSITGYIATSPTTGKYYAQVDTAVSTGTWYVTAGDFDNDGVIDDVVFRNADDPTKELVLYSVLGNHYKVTLPGSDNVVEVWFGSSEFVGGAGDEIEVINGYKEGAPGYITVNFSEDVTLKNVTQKATVNWFNFWVDNYNWDFAVVKSISNPEYEALSNYHESWVFEEGKAGWRWYIEYPSLYADFDGYTQCDISRQYSGFLKNFEDKAGNPGSGTFQGVFTP